MIDDISQGISYVCNNVVEFGGNPNKRVRALLKGRISAGISCCRKALFKGK
ncbi:isoprenylcysteine alpha-carbonyl methylesterase ICME [Dorcoceras hygrometricum]|uniref:Isoprenylcysteine alpha-carbonyl methylesterase ICME n=1 Tax=Dorcoceras hygrometricum TaxID=472368 RepID=A0A2Z7AS64_9LAMI|nr:isoprenylcysteine alpha-carbonyl methylesterase ICME [Dorcoceras hygrometricum]